MKKILLLISLLVSANCFSQTNYGAFINNNITVPQKINAEQSLGVKYIRHAYNLDQPMQQQVHELKTIENAGFKVLLVVNNSHRNRVAFPHNLDSFKIKLRALFDIYKPEIASFENEPTTRKFHQSNFSDYLKELDAGVKICNEYQIKCSDGGITWRVINLIATGKHAMALSGLNDKATEVKQLLAYEQFSTIDYINFHSYQGDTSTATLKVNLAYLATFGKPVICNELGTYSLNPDVMLHEIRVIQLPYVIFYSGDSKAKSLVNADGTLSNLGLTFKSYIQ